VNRHSVQDIKRVYKSWTHALYVRHSVRDVACTLSAQIRGNVAPCFDACEMVNSYHQSFQHVTCSQSKHNASYLNKAINVESDHPSKSRSFVLHGGGRGAGGWSGSHGGARTLSPHTRSKIVFYIAAPETLQASYTRTPIVPTDRDDGLNSHLSVTRPVTPMQSRSAWNSGDKTRRSPR
jgi:hypothetical protein